MLTDDPGHRVNRYPWNRATSVARATLEDFIAIARRALDETAAGRLPFDPGQGKLVLDWLAGLLERRPGQQDD